MAKKEWEVSAKNRFVEYLARSRGQEWNVLAEDVVVDKKTGRNFDYQLGFHGKQIALEIFRLIEDPTELAAQATWIELKRRIEDELIRKAVKDCVV